MLVGPRARPGGGIPGTDGVRIWWLSPPSIRSVSHSPRTFAGGQDRAAHDVAVVVLAGIGMPVVGGEDHPEVQAEQSLVDQDEDDHLERGQYQEHSGTVRRDVQAERCCLGDPVW